MKFRHATLALAIVVLLAGCGMGLLTSDEDSDVTAAADGTLGLVFRLTDYDALTGDGGDLSAARVIDPNTRYIDIYVGNKWVRGIDLTENPPERDALGYLNPIAVELNLPPGNYPSIEIAFARVDGSMITLAGDYDGFTITADETTQLALNSVPVNTLMLEFDRTETVTGDQGSTAYGEMNVSAGSVIDITIETILGSKPKLLLFDALGRPILDFYPAANGATMIDSFRFLVDETTAGTVYIGIYGKDGPFEIEGTARLVSMELQPAEGLLITEVKNRDPRTIEIGNFTAESINLKGYKVRILYPDYNDGVYGDPSYERNTFIIDDDVLLPPGGHVSFLSNYGWWNYDHDKLHVATTRDEYLATRRSGNYVEIAKVGSGVNLYDYWWSYGGEWETDINDVWYRNGTQYLTGFSNPVVADRVKASPDGSHFLYSDYWQVPIWDEQSLSYFYDYRYVPLVRTMDSTVNPVQLIQGVQTAPLASWAGNDSVLFVRNNTEIVKVPADGSAFSDTNLETVLLQCSYTETATEISFMDKQNSTISITFPDSNAVGLAFPVMSPDGRRMTLSIGPASGSAPQEVYIVDFGDVAQAGSFYKLPGQTDGWFQVMPEWSPDGNKLAFVQTDSLNSYSYEPQNGRIMVYDLSTPELPASLVDHGLYNEDSSIRGSRQLLDGWADDSTLMVSSDIYGNPTAYRLLLTGSSSTGWLGKFQGAVGRTDQYSYYDSNRYSLVRVLPTLPASYDPDKANLVVTKKWDPGTQALRYSWLDFRTSCAIALMAPDGSYLDVVDIGNSGAVMPTGAVWLRELGELHHEFETWSRRTASDLVDPTIPVAQDTDSALDWVRSYGTLGYRNDYRRDDEDLFVDIR